MAGAPEAGVPQGTIHYRRPDAAANRAEWHRYYGPKRAPHQHLQLALLGRTDARTVLEIGPYLGFVTALLDNAGYAVTTLDLGPRQFARPDVPHLSLDLTAPGARLPAHDAILACEILEHLPFDAALACLGTFRARARWLVISVPFRGFACYLSLHATLWGGQRAAWARFGSWRRFVPEADPLGHKWELGWRGYSVRRWEAALRDAGWRLRERVMSAPTRSVFHLAEAD
jgi:hypothetical protein